MENGEILKKMRVNSALSHTELAKRAGISRSWVYAVEKGDCASPSIDVVNRWIDVCKPKGDKSEWFELGCLLLFKDLEALKSEFGVEKEVTSGEQKASGWLHKLVPKWFKKE